MPYGPSHRRLLGICLSLALAVLAVLVVAGCGDGGDSHASASPSPSGDAVAAVVDGTPVQAGEVEQVRAERRFTGQTTGAGPALDEAVERTLMRSEAERLGAVADTAEIDRRITELEASSSGAAALDALLAQAGMSRAQLRQSVTDGVLRETLREARYGDVEATAKQVEQYYARNRARLFTRPASVKLGAIQVRTRMVAQNALDRLDAGRPFAEVARQFSVDPESRDNGGQLGWVLTSSLPPLLRKAVTGAGEGVVPEPVGEGNAWYVLNVEAKRDARVLALATVRDRLAKELTTLERSRALERWLDQAREQATITTP